MPVPTHLIPTMPNLRVTVGNGRFLLSPSLWIDDMRFAGRVFLACLLCCASSLTAEAGDQAGLWKGRWNSHSPPARRAHGGTLRMRLRPAGGNVYHANFSGRFAVVIPYFYRATVTQVGNQLISTKRLGPLGEYRMSLHSNGASASGIWSAAGHSGGIQMRRHR